MSADVTITISIKGGKVSSAAEASPPGVDAQEADLAPPPDVEEPDIAPPPELEGEAEIEESADIEPPTLDDDEAAAISVPEVPQE